MKKLIKVEEVEGEGLMAFLGQKIQIWCLNYIYSGTLVGVNDKCVALEDAGVVYETGPLTAASFKDFQALPGSTWYVSTSAIESFGPVKCG